MPDIPRKQKTLTTDVTNMSINVTIGLERKRPYSYL